MEDIINRSVSINIQNKTYLLESTDVKVQSPVRSGYGLLFRIIDEKTDKPIGCISYFISPTTFAVWKNHTKFEINEDNIKNLFLTVIPAQHIPVSRSVLENKYKNSGDCLTVVIDVRDSGYDQNKSTLYIKSHNSPEEFLKRHIYGGSITDDFVEKEILKLLYAYRQTNEQGYKTKVRVKDLLTIMFLPSNIFLRNISVLEDQGLVDSVKSNDEYVSIGITSKGVRYVRNEYKLMEGGEVVMGDKVHGDKISAVTHGDNSPNVIKSSNVNIINELTTKLEQEIEDKYEGDDKNDLLKEAKEIKSLSESKENYPSIRSKLGNILTRTSEFATIGALIAQLLRLF